MKQGVESPAVEPDSTKPCRTFAPMPAMSKLHQDVGRWCSLSKFHRDDRAIAEPGRTSKAAGWFGLAALLVLAVA